MKTLDCAEYFRSQEGYRRCFEELLKKWKSYGRPAGVIVLEHTSEEERRLLGGILGKSFYESRIRFSFADFEKGLQKTRFAPVDMRELLENYFGMELSTNQEQKRKKQKDRECFFRELYELFTAETETISDRLEATSGGDGSPPDEKEGREEPAAAFWVRQMAGKKLYGYHLLSREFHRDPQAARSLALSVGTAVSELSAAKARKKENTVLAVFAARISGNPHYFDWGTTAGQLLTDALCCIMERDLPENTHQWKELLLEAGIAPDYVSSMVHIYGVSLETAEGPHPAYEAFRECREPCVVTLENLRGIVKAHASGKKVFVVENEMVFSFLTEQIRAEEVCRDAAVLCTSGQLRTAALKLLELLADGGYQICYSGDMDPEGIDIADRLWKRFGDRVQIWRMSPEDYEQGISGEVLKDARMSRMDRVEQPILRKTVRCVRRERRAAYQENILEKLLADLR